MLVSDIFSFVRARHNVNAVTASNATLFLYLNERHRQVVLTIQNAREDYNGEISTTNLVPNQQEYPLPDESMKIKRVEVMMDGSHWYPAQIFDVNQNERPNDATTINQDYVATNPKVEVYDSSLFLLPIPPNAVTNGLKLWFIRRPQNIEVTNVSPEAPKEYHIYICDLMGLDVEVSRGRMSLVQAEEATEAILEIIQQKVNPRKLGQRVQLRARRKNMR